MCHNPLYRNQEELGTLVEYMDSVALLMNKHDLSDKSEREVDQIIKDSELFENFYLKPAVKKVFGLDWESYLRRTYMGPSTSNWTLDIPPKAEDFEEWFNDEKTGKPVVAVSPPRASRAVERQRSAVPSKTAKRSSSDKGEA